MFSQENACPPERVARKIQGPFVVDPRQRPAAGSNNFDLRPFYMVNFWTFIVYDGNF